MLSSVSAVEISLIILSILSVQGSDPRDVLLPHFSQSYLCHPYWFEARVVNDGTVW